LRIVSAVFKLLPLALATLFLIPLQIIATKLGHKDAIRTFPLWFHRLACWCLDLHVHVKGALPAKRPLLLVCNHVSWLDIVVLGSIAPVCFVAKKEVSTWPVISTFARLQRTLFIDRQRRSETGNVASNLAQRLDDGDVMVLFAEGTSSDGTRVLPLKSALIGAVYQAMTVDTKMAFVQPVVLAYTHRSGLPITRGERADIAWYGDMDLGPHLLGVVAGGPVDVSVSFGALHEAHDFDRKTLTKSLENDMSALLQEIMRPDVKIAEKPSQAR
jgi:1-acyl-sn-glycerol-3-phosphate acyltransferase